MGYPPGQGYPLAGPGQGTPPTAGPGRGTPPPVDKQMDGQTRVKTLPSRRTTYAVGNEMIYFGIYLFENLLIFCSVEKGGRFS